MAFSKTQLRAYAKDKRVLVAEDNKMTRTILDSFLKNYFTLVVCTRNGAEAQRAYQKYRFDLVITDINMPHMGGIELITEIKKINDDQSIMVISSEEDANSFIELIDLGIDSFIKKPIDANLIGAKVLKILEHQFFKEEIARFNQEKMLEEYKKTHKLTQREHKNVTDVKRDKIVEAKKEESLHKKDEIQNESEYPNSAIAFIKRAREKHHNLDDIVDEIYGTLDELEDNIADIVKDCVNETSLQNIGRVFSKLYSNISLFDEMQPMADKLFEIHEFFISYEDLDSLSAEQKEAFDFTQYILDDMKNFVFGVFIESSTKDITIYNKLIQNSVDQIRLKIDNIDINEEIELF
jgi:DNA-binding NarL/FixJ family response regulator